MVLVPFYGNAVSGNQRFDRPALQNKLLRTLASSGGVKMFGLRRIGKSTLRLYVVEQMEAAKKPVAFVDAQGLQSIQDLLGEQFDKRFKLYGEIDKDGQRKLVVPVLKRIMDAADGIRLDDLELAEGYSRIDLAEFLDMLVEDGFIHFTEDADANRTWVPASRLARLWWKRSRLA